jgi:galactose mutarotase-like enzyme
MSRYAVEDTARGPYETVRLVDHEQHSSLEICPARGALATSFIAHGREWLYLDETTFADATQNVRGGIPVLFPCPGKLDGDTFFHDSKSYSMKQHGFARRKPMVETARGNDTSSWVELVLASSHETRASYPFEFLFKLRFSLVGEQLTLQAIVQNTGMQGSPLMPFALGYHPYFQVPESQKATAGIPLPIGPAWDNKAKRQVHFVGFQDEYDLTSPEVDIHIREPEVKSERSASLHLAPNPTSMHAAQIQLTGPFPTWVVWTLAGKDFICLEPWSAPGNALNTGKDVIRLAPGHAAELCLTLQIKYP